MASVSYTHLSIPRNPKQQSNGLQIFYQKSYTKIRNRYSKTAGVMIYLHARSISSVPVSYTHLDVYKRQELY